MRDRTAEMAAVLVLEPIFEADLPPEQYAYRKDRSALDAVRHVHKLINTGHGEIVDADLSSYLDPIRAGGAEQSASLPRPRQTGLRRPGENLTNHHREAKVNAPLLDSTQNGRAGILRASIAYSRRSSTSLSELQSSLARVSCWQTSSPHWGCDGNSFEVRYESFAKWYCILHGRQR